MREWVRGLPPRDCHAIGTDLQRVQYRWPVGMPLVRALGEGLFEVRTSLAGNRIARILFCFRGGRLVALHGFMKTSQKIPAADIDLARKRKREVESG